MDFDLIPSQKKFRNRASLIAFALGTLMLIAAPVSFGSAGLGPHQAIAQGEGADKGGGDKGGAESGGGADRGGAERGGAERGGAETGGSADKGGVDSSGASSGTSSADISRDIAAR